MDRENLDLRSTVTADGALWLHPEPLAMRPCVLAEMTTTFASHSTARITLDQALHPETVAVCIRKSPNSASHCAWLIPISRPVRLAKGSRLDFPGFCGERLAHVSGCAREGDAAR